MRFAAAVQSRIAKALSGRGNVHRQAETYEKRQAKTRKKKVIDRETIQKIMDTANIVEVVSEFVTLRRAGVNYRGLCPFHDEKTPSFYVSPARGICKCFSCGKGGNVVHFLMEHEQISYPEALRWLARKYHIEIREKEMTDEEREAENVRESMFVLNDWAAKYFQDILHNHADGIAIGMQYFRSRGFRDDTIREFGLGYCQKERTAFANAALAKGFKEEYILKTGLCYKRDDGRLIDRFSGRVIFPVHTVGGRVVAFGGRVLKTDKETAKYVNSPESEIYNKRSELYGIFVAKRDIQKEDRCFLVEGYTDVISMHQSGIKNVVASSGTSLTPGQIRLIRRFTNNITVLYDGDRAGIKASIRGIDMLLAEGMNVKVLLLPDGDDPDSFARKHNAQEYRQYIDSHQTDFIRFKTKLFMEDSADDPVSRASLIDNMVTSISLIPDKILRSMYVKECSQTMNVDEALLLDAVTKVKREKQAERRREEMRENAGADSAAGAAEPVVETPPGKSSKFENVIMKFVLLYGSLEVGSVNTGDGVRDMNVIDLVKYSLDSDGLEFSSPEYRQIMNEAAAHSHEPGFSPRKYFLYHPDQNISKVAAALESEKYQLRKKEQEKIGKIEDKIGEAVSLSLTDYKLAYVEEEANRVLAELAKPEVANDDDRSAELMKRYNDMKRIEVALAEQAGGRVMLS